MDAELPAAETTRTYWNDPLPMAMGINPWVALLWFEMHVECQRIAHHRQTRKGEQLSPRVAGPDLPHRRGSGVLAGGRRRFGRRRLQRRDDPRVHARPGSI